MTQIQPPPVPQGRAPRIPRGADLARANGPKRVRYDESGFPIRQAPPRFADRVRRMLFR